MALKLKLDTIDGLPKDVQKEYKKADDGEGFVLDVDGFEDTGALKRAKDHEKSARKDAEGKLKQLTTELETAQQELEDLRKGAIPKADVEKLESTYKTKLAKREAELSGELESASKSLQTLLVDNVAQGLAAKVSTSPDLILPHIKSRLTAEKVDGKWQTRIMDKDGKPSDLSIDAFQKEILSDKRFSVILVGSKASGGSANGNPPRTSRSPADNGGFNPNKASVQELAAQLKARKDASGE